jgi:hypothetical protein
MYSSRPALHGLQRVARPRVERDADILVCVLVNRIDARLEEMQIRGRQARAGAEDHNVDVRHGSQLRCDGRGGLGGVKVDEQVVDAVAGALATFLLGGQEKSESEAIDRSVAAPLQLC